MKKMKKSTYAACVIWYYGKIFLEAAFYILGIYAFIILLYVLF